MKPIKKDSANCPIWFLKAQVVVVPLRYIQDYNILVCGFQLRLCDKIKKGTGVFLCPMK
jgi:hypothetical protein